MPDTPQLTLFFVAAVALLVTPGPAVLYIVARSIEQGRMAGVVSTLGIALGTLVHVAAAAFGLSALLVSSALAFSVVKYLGAAYLIYLGLRKLFGRDEATAPDVNGQRKHSSMFYQGIVVSILNPKTALFFFAFLPQFTDVSGGGIATQILFLGTTFVLMGITSDSIYAMLAGTLGNSLRTNRRVLRFQRLLSGSIFLALGISAAFSGPVRK